MKIRTKIILIAVAVLLLFGSGYIFARWRHSAHIAGYDKREAERMEKVAANEAEINQLRGINNQLRKENSALSASEEGYKQLIAEKGGAIATEAKKLENIYNELQNDQTSAMASTDRCDSCRQFSTRLLARKAISKPLACTDECSGTNR
jgi:hypothetical protein